MDYEKKYKQALSRAKAFELPEYKNIAESIFPELKESEDERIRKALVDALNKNLGNGIEKYGITLNAALAWLEKQGNNTPTIIWHNIDEKPEEMKELFCEWESDDATWHDVAFYDEESHTFRHAKMPINVTKWVYVDELLEKQGDCSAKWEKNTADNKPTIRHSVLMKTTQGIAEGEWQGEHWFQYRWSWTLKDSDVLAWMELSDLDEQGEQKPIVDFKAKDWYVSKVDGKIHDMTYNPTDKVVIKKGEKFTTWSDGDDAYKEFVISAVEDFYDEKNPLQKTLIDWLKSLKDRIGG